MNQAARALPLRTELPPVIFDGIPVAREGIPPSVPKVRFLHGSSRSRLVSGASRSNGRLDAHGADVRTSRGTAHVARHTHLFRHTRVVRITHIVRNAHVSRNEPRP